MDVAQTIHGIEQTARFKEWRKANKAAYLTSAFTMFGSDDEKEWLISYYDPGGNTFITFSSAKELREQEPFTKEEKIPQLKLEEAKVSDKEALEEAKKALRKNYGTDEVQRTVMVLQELNDTPTWNITFITETFKVANIKISAKDGRLISHSTTAISEFMQMPEKNGKSRQNMQ